MAQQMSDKYVSGLVYCNIIIY